MNELNFIEKLESLGFKKKSEKSLDYAKVIDGMLIMVQQIDENRWGVIKHLHIEHISERVFYNGFKNFAEIIDIVRELESTYLRLKEME